MLCARERTSSWKSDSIQKYSSELIEWLKANLETRAKTLEEFTGKPFPIVYEYLAPTEDRKKLRILEKFSERRLSKKDTEVHVTHSLTELEEIRTSLAKEELKAAKLWDEKNGDKEEVKELKNGSVFGVNIDADRLGVILDNSHSMSPYLEKLKAEITNEFPNAYFVEVNGCQLTRTKSASWFYTSPIEDINPFQADRHIDKVPTWQEHPYSVFLEWKRDLFSAMVAVAELMKMDTIYWFCDFDDDTYDHIIKNLGQKLIAEDVTLYVHTLRKNPPKLMKMLVERTGGKYFKKRV